MAISRGLFNVAFLAAVLQESLPVSGQGPEATEAQEPDLHSDEYKHLYPDLETAENPGGRANLPPDLETEENPDFKSLYPDLETNENPGGRAHLPPDLDLVDEPKEPEATHEAASEVSQSLEPEANPPSQQVQGRVPKQAQTALDEVRPDATQLTPDECVDGDEECPEWAEAGECKNNPEHMLEHCPLSCGVCKGIEKSKECVDADENCPDWAAEGECTNNPENMHFNCPLSCGKCSTGVGNRIAQPQEATTEPPEMQPAHCVDQNENCEAWVKTGECEKNPEFMNQVCMRSCKICTATAEEEAQAAQTQVAATDPSSASSCVDSSEYCKIWADAGECEKNPDNMERNCPASCGTCDKLVEAASQDSDSGKSVETFPEESSAPSSGGDCTDQSDHCVLWAAAEQCTQNAAYMKDMCPLSCQMCSRTNSSSAQKNVRGGKAPDKSQSIGNGGDGRSRNDLVRGQDKSYIDVPAGGLAHPGSSRGEVLHGREKKQPSSRQDRDRHANQVNQLQRLISIAASLIAATALGGAVIAMAKRQTVIAVVALAVAALCITAASVLMLEISE